MLSWLLTGTSIFLIYFKPVIRRLNHVLPLFISSWAIPNFISNRRRLGSGSGPGTAFQVMLVDRVFDESDRL